jgi:ubiquinone/menaquinone biosynthesis C-methylase UbiE
VRRQRRSGRPGERLFWNVQSVTWDDLLQKPRHRLRLEAVLALVTEGGRPGDRLLDLGCGTGTYSVALAKAGFEVVGLDFAAAMLRRAEAKAGDLPGPRLRFERADFNRPLPFADGSFDHVICVCALHCVHDPPAFFGEVRRVLVRNGGFVLVALAGRCGEPASGLRFRTSTPRRAFWWVKRRMAGGRRWARYSRVQLLGLLRDSGFDVERRLERGPAILVRPAGEAPAGTGR